MSNPEQSPPRRRAGLFGGLGRNVVILGVVSLLTDISSEMIYPVIPIFLTTVLNAPMSVVGLIEGIAESAASFLKIIFGWLSDRTGKQRGFVFAGYGLSALSKPLLALAGAWPLVLGARLLDRVGKGVRTSPRDVMIASSCDEQNRGKAFGLHRSMDTIGAVAGPLIAAMLLANGSTNYRLIFLLAFIPAGLGVLAILFTRTTAVAERKAAQDRAKGVRPPLSPELKRFVLVYALFALGNSSDVFLLLRVKALGLSTSTVLMTYVFYNAVYAMAAGPAGWLSDRLSRRALLVAGFVVFAAVYLGFAFALTPLTAWPLFALYGLYGAATEGTAKALVTDLSVKENRGTAMGLFHTVTGVLVLFASTTAGFLWSRIGPSATFVYGAACAVVAAAGLCLVKMERKGKA